MTSHDHPPHYHIYLLTVWEERTQDSQTEPVWRFRLEDPRTGQQRGFATLEALAADLKQALAANQMHEKQENG